jgi:hypothetical protein
VGVSSCSSIAFLDCFLYCFLFVVGAGAACVAGAGAACFAGAGAACFAGTGAASGGEVCEDWGRDGYNSTGVERDKRRVMKTNNNYVESVKGLQGKISLLGSYKESNTGSVR